MDDPVNTMIPLIPGRDRFIKEGRKRGREEGIFMESFGHRNEYWSCLEYCPRKNESFFLARSTSEFIY